MKMVVLKYIEENEYVEVTRIAVLELVKDMLEYRYMGGMLDKDKYIDEVSELTEIFRDDRLYIHANHIGLHADYILEKFNNWTVCDINSLERILEIAK